MAARIRVDTRAHTDLIKDSARVLYDALLTARNRDQEKDTVLWWHCLAGKHAEVAYAMITGLPPMLVMHDKAGSADFVLPRYEVDVKAMRHNQDRVSVRQDVLHHDRLIAVMRPNDPVGGVHHCDAIGWTHTRILRTYEVQPPAHGHGKPYVWVKAKDIVPFTEVAA